MKLSLSEISTPAASFEEDVRAYATAGFESLGLWEFKLPDRDDRSLTLLREHGLSVSNAVPAVPSILPLNTPEETGPEDPAERVSAISRSVARLAAFDPECVLILTGPAETRDRDAARSIVVQALRQIGETCRRLGIGMGLEPVHPTQDSIISFIHSPEEAVGLLTESGCADHGVVLDTYHLWDYSGAERWITANARKVAGFQMSDWPGDPACKGRLLPGATSSRSRDLVTALALTGWRGSLDVEIFSEPDGFWGLAVDEAAAAAYRAAVAIVA